MAGVAHSEFKSGETKDAILRGNKKQYIWANEYERQVSSF